MKQAAEILGISSEGVRKRIKRGNLDHEKDPDGKVYVWLDVDRTGVGEDGGKSTEEVLREQVDYLKEIIAQRDEEIRRRDHLLAAALERIPALEEGPRDERNADLSASSEPDEGQREPDRDGGPQNRSSFSWWRRLLGG